MSSKRPRPEETDGMSERKKRHIEKEEKEDDDFEPLSESFPSESSGASLEESSNETPGVGPKLQLSSSAEDNPSSGEEGDAFPSSDVSASEDAAEYSVSSPSSSSACEDAASKKDCPSLSDLI